MRWWTAYAILVLLLLPADTAVARPAAPAPAVPGPALPPPGGPAVAVPVGGYRWPLARVPAVTRPFLPPRRPRLPGRRGVDLGGSPGVLVLAAGTGVVAFAGSVAGVGVVSIDHPGGLRITYEPVTPLVA